MVREVAFELLTTPVRNVKEPVQTAPARRRPSRPRRAMRRCQAGWKLRLGPKPECPGRLPPSSARACAAVQ
eukprot:5740560-Pyramimonas_sp.AAC.1